MGVARLAGIGLLVASGIACRLAPPATVAQDQAVSLPSRPEHAMAPSRHPGFTVPGSQVSMPGRVRAGSTVEGRAPVGSRIEAVGQAVDVGEDMRFRLRIPVDARDVIPVRVVRPDHTVLVLCLKVVED